MLVASCFALDAWVKKPTGENDCRKRTKMFFYNLLLHDKTTDFPHTVFERRGTMTKSKR